MQQFDNLNKKIEELGTRLRLRDDMKAARLNEVNWLRDEIIRLQDEITSKST